MARGPGTAIAAWDHVCDERDVMDNLSGAQCGPGGAVTLSTASADPEIFSKLIISQIFVLCILDCACPIENDN